LSNNETNFWKIINALGLVFSPLILFAITTLSFLPLSGVESKAFLIPHFDKIAHLLSYTALGGAMFFAVAKESGNLKKAIVIIILGLVIGFSIEIIQPYFNRSFELLDIVSDFVGLVLGVYLASKILSLLNKVFKDMF
jgi:VanZ family protein